MATVHPIDPPEALEWIDLCGLYLVAEGIGGPPGGEGQREAEPKRAQKLGIS